MFGQNLRDSFAQRFGVRLPFKIYKRTGDASIDIVWGQGECTIQCLTHCAKLPEFLIAERDLLQHEKIARVELDGPLQVSCGFIPQALTPVDVPRQFKDLRVVW